MGRWAKSLLLMLILGLSNLLLPYGNQISAQPAPTQAIITFDDPATEFEDIWFKRGEGSKITLDAPSENDQSDAIDRVDITVKSVKFPHGITVTLTETGTNTGVFKGDVKFTFGSSSDANDLLQVANGDVVRALYNSINATLNIHATKVSETPETSFVPKISVSGNNQYVVWNEDKPGNNEIFFRVSNDGGDTFGNVINLSNNDDDSDFPQLAVSNNNVYLIWEDRTPGEKDIFLRVSNDGGDTFGNVINLSNNAESSVHPQLAVSGDNVYVVWRDGSFPNCKTFFRVSNDGGDTWNPPLTDPPVNVSSTLGGSSSPKLAVSGANVYTVWHDNTPGNNDVFFRVSNDGGDTWNPPLTDPPRNLTNNAESSVHPQLAVSGDNVYVVWRDGSFPNYEIFLRVSNDGGDTFGNVRNLSNSPPNSDFPLLHVSDNSVHVAYRDGPPGKKDILLRTSTDNGVHFGDPVNVTNSNGTAFNAKIVSSGSNVTMIWEDYIDKNKEIFIAFSRDAGANFGNPFDISQDNKKSHSPQLHLISGKVHVAFVEASHSHNDIITTSLVNEERLKNYERVGIGDYLKMEQVGSVEFTPDDPFTVEPDGDIIVGKHYITAAFCESLDEVRFGIDSCDDTWPDQMVKETWFASPSFSRDGNTVRVTSTTSGAPTVEYIFGDDYLKHRITAPSLVMPTVTQQLQLRFNSFVTNDGICDSVPLGQNLIVPVLGNEDLTAESVRTALGLPQGTALPAVSCFVRKPFMDTSVDPPIEMTSSVIFRNGGQDVLMEILNHQITRLEVRESLTVSGVKVVELEYEFENGVVDPATCGSSLCAIRHDVHNTKTPAGTGVIPYCPEPGTGAGGSNTSTRLHIRVPKPGEPTYPTCARAFTEFYLRDGTLTGASTVTDVQLKIHVDNKASPRNCSYVSMHHDHPPTELSTWPWATQWEEIGDNDDPQYLANHNSCTLSGFVGPFSLTSAATTDVMHYLDEMAGWPLDNRFYAVGIKYTDESEDTTVPINTSYTWISSKDRGSIYVPVLTITFTP